MTRESQNFITHAAPFLVWIGLQMLLPATAGTYAVRTAATAVVGAALLLWTQWRPHKPSLRIIGTGLVGGLAVAILWIAPECSAWYRTWFVYPIGALPPPATSSPYDPAVCGWTLTIVKLIGSAFVIAPVEEVFFRSFLYRWLQNRDFASASLAQFDLSAFLWMILLFTLEHDRPFAAALAGAIYGLLAIRVGLGAAILAHIVTNLLLALHVIVRGAWGFW